MLWLLASAWGDSPPRNSWTTCRLNSIECVRCLAMRFLLESPVQLADSQVPYLSTPRGALQSASKIDPLPFGPDALLALIRSGRWGNADSGDDWSDSARAFAQGQDDQGDRPGPKGVPEHGPQGPAIGSDFVRV